MRKQSKITINQLNNWLQKHAKDTEHIFVHVWNPKNKQEETYYNE